MLEKTKMSQNPEIIASEIVSKVQFELSKIKDGEKKRRITRFIIASLSSIPWIGGFLSASSSLNSEIEQSKSNDIFELWLKEHSEKINELGQTIANIIQDQ